MSWRDLLLNNLWWKLLSLALAIMIWSGAQNLESRERALERTLHEVPIRVVSTPNAGRAVLLEPATAEIDVAGDWLQVKALRAADVLVFAEINESLARGSTTNRVDARLPAGIKLLRVVPARVVVTPLPDTESTP